MDGYVLPAVVLLGSLLTIPVASRRWRLFRQRLLSGSLDREGVRVVEITIQGGFHPATVRVRRGERVRLLFRRAEADPCTARVYLTHPRISRTLPAFATTALSFVADTPGSHLFTCEEGRHRGHLVVKPADA